MKAIFFIIFFIFLLRQAETKEKTKGAEKSILIGEKDYREIDFCGTRISTTFCRDDISLKPGGIHYLGPGETIHFIKNEKPALKKCRGCGSPSFTNGRCDYCGSTLETLRVGRF